MTTTDGERRLDNWYLVIAAESIYSPQERQIPPSERSLFFEITILACLFIYLFFFLMFFSAKKLTRVSCNL